MSKKVCLFRAPYLMYVVTLEASFCTVHGYCQIVEDSVRNSQGNKGRAQKQLRGFKYIKWQQSEKTMTILVANGTQQNKHG
jgi:hypothetical protein